MSITEFIWAKLHPSLIASIVHRALRVFTAEHRHLDATLYIRSEFANRVLQSADLLVAYRQDFAANLRDYTLTGPVFSAASRTDLIRQLSSQSRQCRGIFLALKILLYERANIGSLAAHGAVEQE